MPTWHEGEAPFAHQPARSSRQRGQCQARMQAVVSDVRASSASPQPSLELMWPLSIYSLTCILAPSALQNRGTSPCVHAAGHSMSVTLHPEVLNAQPDLFNSLGRSQAHALPSPHTTPHPSHMLMSRIHSNGMRHACMAQRILVSTMTRMTGNALTAPHGYSAGVVTPPTASLIGST